MDFKLLTVVFLVVCVTENYGMPADPIFRTSAAQSNNPFVKVFSTYPTEKPKLVKDNPNELKKASEEEKKILLKKSKSKSESDAIIPDQLENPPETDSDLDKTEQNEENEREITEVLLEESHSTKDEEIDLSDADLSKSLAPEDSLTASSSDVMEIEEIERHEILPDMSEPIEDMMASQSQLDDIRPIAIEAPLQFLPPIVEREDVNKFIFDSMGNVEILDEPSHSFIVEQPSPSIIPSEMPKEVEVASPVVEDPLGTKTMVKPTTIDAVEPMKTVAETAEERMEPMASLTETNMPLEPVVEMEPEMTETTTAEIVTESVTEEITTEQPIIKDDGVEELGEIGVSMSESESDLITPIVEAEPNVMFTVGEVEEITPVQESAPEKERVSLKIIKSKSEESKPEVIEGSQFVLREIIQTEEPVPMAGFMSDESKSKATETDTKTTEEEHMIPSTTELTYVLNIEEEVTTQIPAEDSVNTEDVIENSPEAIASNSESASDLSTLSTTPAVPIVDPIELALQEEQDSGNDPSINETI